MKDKVGFILTLLALWFMSSISLADAGTFYAGTGGNKLCNGTKDLPFSMTDNVNCRFETPARFPSGANTLIINGGTYSISQPINLSSNSTLTGKGGVKLVGMDRASSVLRIVGVSNVIVDGLEITDGSECQETGPNPCNRDTPPYGPWSQNGIYMSDATNILIKNTNIHGMAYRGMWVGRLQNVTLEDVKIINNSFSGVDGDLGQGVNSSNSGTNTMTRVAIKGAGCGERLNGTRYNCYSQSQTPTGYGDAWGFASTSGKWIFNDCDISENVSDGIDLLYHRGDADVVINGGTMKNNAGNSVKSGGHNTTITGTEIGGDCNYFKKHPEYVWKMNADSSSYGFDHCRAKGDNLAVVLGNGGKVTLDKVKFTSVTNFAILSAGSACNGSEKVIANNTTFDLLSGARKYYASGLPDGNGQGPCGQIPLTETNVPTEPTDTTPPVISNISSNTPTQTSATISWLLSEKATGQIEYGKTTAYGQVSELESGFLDHHVQNLMNLIPSTTYNYRVVSKDQAGNIARSVNQSFKTTGAVCVPDNSCANVECGKTCVDNCGNVIAGKPCPTGSCQMTVPVPCDQVQIK